MSRRRGWFSDRRTWYERRRDRRPRRAVWERRSERLGASRRLGCHARVCVQFHERTAPPPVGHWTWEREREAAECAEIVGISACRRRESPLHLNNEEWVAQYLDGTIRPIVEDFEHPVEPGRYVAQVGMGASHSEWTGEYDEWMEVLDVRRSPGTCKTYWRRRAHERRAARAAGRT